MPTMGQSRGEGRQNPLNIVQNIDKTKNPVKILFKRTGGKIQLSGVDVPTCVCNAGVKGAINGIPFHKVAFSLKHIQLTVWMSTCKVSCFP